MIANNHVTCHYVHDNRCRNDLDNIRKAMFLLYQAITFNNNFRLSEKAFGGVMTVVNVRQSEFADELTISLLVAALESAHAEYFKETSNNNGRYIQIGYDDVERYFTLQMFNESGSCGGCYSVYVYDREKERDLMPSEVAERIISIAEKKLNTRTKAKAS